jgi:hypothetical protein
MADAPLRGGHDRIACLSGHDLTDFEFISVTKDGFCNIPKNLHSKITRIKNYLQMHFKNYKLSKLYYPSKSCPSYVHPNYISSIYILLRDIGITRPFLTSLSFSLSFRPMPDNGACVDPTTIAAASAPALGPPHRLWQLARRHDSGSHLPPFSSTFFSMHGNSTFIYAQQIKQDKAPTKATSTFTIYHANKQGTQAACMYHQHAKHKQTSVSSAPTHTHIQIAHACMQNQQGLSSMHTRILACMSTTMQS